MQHYIMVNRVRIQVDILRPYMDGLQVEAKREYRGPKNPKTQRSAVLVCKGQTFTVPHDQIFKVPSDVSRNASRSKAFKARMRKLHASGMPLESPESHSETLSAVPSGNPSKCPVCASEHATGSCTMTNVLEGK